MDSLQDALKQIMLALDAKGRPHSSGVPSESLCDLCIEAPSLAETDDVSHADAGWWIKRMLL